MMKEYNDHSFAFESVTLDDGRFTGCDFDHCTIHYAGGPVQLLIANMKHCDFEFHGPAASTMQLLRKMYNSSPDGRALVLRSLQGDGE